MTRYAVEVRYDVRVPVRDGLELSANMWLPEPRAPGERFPAILELIPYRKDDWRFQADHSRMTYLAERGYACCRLDVRGTGSSPGVAEDEYTAQETQDGYDTVAWLAAQPWCSGSVGMWGISYGGFTAIQVAALRPPALKAIVPVYATDDRYTDDVHYIGGCAAASELAQYAVGMVAMNALPPRASYARDAWAARWRERLERTPPWLITWLRHQTDGPYWRQGSLAPSYDAIGCAVLAIGGWADGYVGPALRMQERCSAPRKALVGPWVHELPDGAYPGPNVDYLHEMVRFFDHWLKGAPNGVMDEPPLTFFLQQYAPPQPFPRQAAGAWRSLAAYPSPAAAALELALGAGTLGGTDPAAGADRLRHRPTIGTRGPLCFGAGSPPTGLARDLRPDEALALTYTGAPLEEPLDVLGFPEALLHLSADAPVAHVAVRLADVAPDGTSAHVSTGILNLTHRDGHESPRPLEPGAVYAVRVPLKAVGYRFLPGHRLRLSVMSACWPIVFPSPHRSTLTLHRGPGAPSRLVLPTLPPGATLDPPALKDTPPELVACGGGSSAPPEWRIEEDVIAGSVTVHLASDDTSALPDGTTLRTAERIVLTAFHDDPADARVTNEELYELSERGYTTRVRSTGTIRATETDFHVDLQLEVDLNGRPFFHKAWLESIPREMV